MTESTIAPISYLTSRRSQKLVVAPAPTSEQLAQILQTAMCAPDHAALRVWRFAIIEQQHVAALTDLAIDATRRSGRDITPEKEQNMRKWLSEVPMLIGLALSLIHI